MSFQRAALSLKSKLHLSDLKTSTLALASLLAIAGICVLVATIVHVVSAGGFVLTAAEGTQASMSEQIEFSNDPRSSVNEEVGSPQSLIVVYVSGSVQNPGVYELKEGSRVADAVLLAGGGTDDALLESVNLARVLFDGEQVHVPSNLDTSLGAISGPSPSAATAATPHQLININTANVEQLLALDGVGEATASKIISDRESNGPFASKEDIMRVSGIGQKKYEAIKDHICV